MKNIKAYFLQFIFFVLALNVNLYAYSASFFHYAVLNLEESTKNYIVNTANTSLSYIPDSRNCGNISLGNKVVECTGSTGTIGGLVFEDLDADGEKTLIDEKGIGGVTVKLIDSLDKEQLTNTDSLGNYLFENLTNQNYRIEFNIPTAISCWAKPSLSGSAENTLVQFKEPGDCANLALIDPSYCGTNPLLAATCFVDGEPLLGGTSANGDVLVSYPYNAPDASDIKKLALNEEAGAVWGLAYDKNTQNFFAGAMLKRHAGFGPLGIDGIYKINSTNPSQPVVESWLKLSDIGVDVGADPRTYDLPADAGKSNADPATFSLIGKIGLGDVDLSTDGQTLYAMNLNNNGSLIIIDVPTKTLIKEVSIGNPGCGADGDVRPWAIKIHNGEVYVGLICSGQIAGATDLNFFVLKLQGGQFVEVFSESLDYQKGVVHVKHNANNPVDKDLCSKWETWMDDYSGIHAAGFASTGPRWCRPQPILSDMEFDKDGSLILAFMDRIGHQTGYAQFNTEGTQMGSGYVGGDLLRVHNNNGVFELENEGTTSNGGGCGLNGEGPGGGEYYCGEELANLHAETSLGAVAMTGTDDLIVLNVMDPLGVFSGGTSWINNQTGQRENAFELYNSNPATGPIEEGTFGKAAGLGDLEFVCETAPIEIGNLVWHDNNFNGIQDPNEEGLANIPVELIKDGQIIAMTTTSTNGSYYFSKDGAANQTWLSSGNSVQPNTEYTIRVKSSLLWQCVTTKISAQDSTNLSYLRDNNGVLVGDAIEATIKTGVAGCSDHNYDFGLSRALCLGNLVWEDVNNDGLMNNQEKGIPNAIVTLCSVGADNQKGGGDDVDIEETQTDADGHYLFDELLEGKYYVKVEIQSANLMFSSSGTGIGGLGNNDYEPAGSPNNDQDNNDDGTQMGNIIMSEVVMLNYDQEPDDDEDTSTLSNTTVDFGVFSSLSLGNKVWMDNNNNGLLDDKEKGINGVEVTLFDAGKDQLKDTPDDITVAVTTTDFNGCYNFDQLPPGKYWLKITNGIPKGTISSDGNGMAYDGFGIYELGVDPDNDEDMDDNGMQMDAMIMSKLIDLEINSEPMDDADTMNYTNTTVDFALFPIHQIMLYESCNCLNNESNLNAGDGQFSEEIVILSPIAGENWTLKSGTGLYATNSPIPPAAPLPLAIGTPLVQNGVENGMYKYVLSLRHIDGIGYDACFTNGIATLTINNSCNYEDNCQRIIVAQPDGTPMPIVDTCVKQLVLDATGTTKIDTIKCCDNQSSFVDDGSKDGNYIDTVARTDTYIVCVQDKNQVLQFNFTEFDIATGDTLYIYDGKNNAAPLIKKVSGSGVSQTGGHVSANCDPYINNTGCLTFELKTNGDRQSGTGWNGTFSCQERNITLVPQNDLSAILDCRESYKVFSLKPAITASNCSGLLDTQFIRIYNAQGELCRDTCIGGTETFMDTFALGQYLVEYKLKSDTTKIERTSITVQAPSLTCNDVVNIPLGSACSIAIAPDDLLENPCDTITDTLYYHITLCEVDKNGNEKILASGGGKGGQYPIITKEMMTSCQGSFIAKIERRYYENLTLSFCNNGVQKIKCSTTINAFDQTPPIFTNATRQDTVKLIDISLEETTFQRLKPTATDNCDSATVSFASATIINDNLPCDTSRIQVSWIATDNCGNSATLTQEVVVLRPTLSDIVNATDVTLSCGEDDLFALDDLNKTGVPGIQVGRIKNGLLDPTDTLDLNLETYVGGYILQKRDIQVPYSCGIKVFRYWEVLDWCDTNSGIMPIDTQLIELTDTIAPKFTENTLDTAMITLPHDACTTDITKLAQPVATDLCSTVEVRIDSVFRLENGEFEGLSNSSLTALNCDTFQIRWIATDGCPSQLKNDTIAQIVIITDDTKPSVICTDKINISLGLDKAKLHYRDIDAGSSDACGISKYEVSRDEMSWDSVVTFDCIDVHQEVMVWLRVTDTKGNQNTCWMTVNVEDKISPICSPLPDAEGTCEEAHIGALGDNTDTNANGLFDDEWVDMTAEQISLFNTQYGIPNCSDNVTCLDLVIQQQYQLVEKSCGIQIKRRYRAVDWDGEGMTSDWQEQKITIEPEDEWRITFPSDWVGACGDTIPNTSITIEVGACDLMAYEVAEKTFTIIEDACLKVVRTYTIINWCNYQAGQETVRIARVENEEGMVTTPLTINREDYKDAGKLEYIQILKLHDNTPPTITVADVDNCMEGNDCSELKQFAITATDCNEAATAALDYNWALSADGIKISEGEGASFEAMVSSKQQYEVQWRVADNCGNIAQEKVSHNFWDCKKPSPYCLHGIAVELMPDAGMVQVWANDLNHNSSDNCTSTDKLQFRLWHAALGDAPTHIAEVIALPESITFNCATLGNQTVHLYVIDEDNNWDFCVTYVNVQDNMDACRGEEPSEGMARVQGSILDWQDRPVESVWVRTNSSTSVTGEGGDFQFNLPKGLDYIIEPNKEGNPLNGVSTFDLVLMAKHILGIQLFENPYQKIAADINQSGAITAFDMVQLRKLILNIDKAFVNNTSWKFVDAAYQFTTENPLTENYPTSFDINKLSEEVNVDFVAVKIGDVNGSAVPNNLVQTEERTNKPLFELMVADKDLKKGQQYTVNFTAEQLATIQGYQFTLAFDHLQLNQLTNDLANTNAFGWHLVDEGTLTTSWNAAWQTPEKQHTSSVVPQQLFTLHFTALKDGRLSEHLRLLPQPTQMEAYDANGQVMALQLNFKPLNNQDQFELYQNVPNPFQEATVVGFYLPNSSDVELTLRDEMGRVIHAIKEHRPQGYNEIKLDKKHPNSGFIYYQLHSRFGTQTKKMLQLK